MPGADDDDVRAIRCSHEPCVPPLGAERPCLRPGRQARLTTMVLSSVRRSSEYRPPTRPRPLWRAGTAAEGQVGLPVVGAFVDVDPAAAGRLGELQPAPQVPREDSRQQAVRRRVDDASASSWSSIAVTGATGPNVSSRAMAIRLGDPVEDRRLEEERAAGVGARAAPGDEAWPRAPPPRPRGGPSCRRGARC